MAGCESGYIAPKPGDPDVTYAGCYGGYIGRLDRRTGQERGDHGLARQPDGLGRRGHEVPLPVDVPDRGLAPRQGRRSTPPATCCSAPRTRARAGRPISPDLTRNDKTKLGPSGGPITKDNTSVEYYGTIFALAESPRDAQVLWAGSDDGLVHVTRDGGKTWTNVTPKGLPEWSRISQIDASPHDAGTAWLAVNRYQLDDYRPYVYVTTDFGATWRAIATGLPADSFVRVVREDPVRRGLLFAGTETGVHVSFDAGASWQPLQRNLPVVPVTDLVIKDADVVVSTQGRSFWILDDIAALRQAKPELAAAPAHLFAPSPAYRFGGPEGRGAAGKNPPYGARLQYLLKDAPKEGEEIKLEILDAKGALVRALVVEGGEDRRGPRPRARGLLRPARPEDDPGQGRPQQLHVGPAPPGGLQVQGPDPVERPDRGAARGPGPLRGAAHGRRPDAEPGVRGAQGPAARDERRRLREAAGAAAEDPRQAHGRATTRSRGCAACATR